MLGLMCLAQGHNAATPVRLEPAAPRSRVKHSTTEPLRYLSIMCIKYSKSNLLGIFGGSLGISFSYFGQLSFFQEFQLSSRLSMC